MSHKDITVKRQYQKEWARNFRKKNRGKINAAARRYTRKIKWECLSHYSDGLPACKCCGVDHIGFLAIDHIYGKGKEHRKSLNISGGAQFYNFLKKNGYPKGYQVLCFNCNHSAYFYGICPHETGLSSEAWQKKEIEKTLR